MPDRISSSTGPSGPAAQLPQPAHAGQQQAQAQPPGPARGWFSALARRSQPAADAAQPAAPRARLPWIADGAARDMVSLSDQRDRRWLRKSASEQYLYAKSLTPQQRSSLEQSLEQRLRGTEDPQQRSEALAAWLSVQQARLRTHSPQQRASHRRQQLVLALPAATVLGSSAAAVIFRMNRRDYYAAPDRPEYRVAYTNFLRIIGDDSLGMDLRMQAAQRLAYHARREGTLAFSESAALSMAGGPAWVQQLGNAIPPDEPHVLEVAGAFALAQAWRAGGGAGLGGSPVFSLEQDLAAQTEPLGYQMNEWLRAAGQPALADAGAFDNEPLALSFARLLARRQPAEAGPGADEVLQQGVRVLRAIARDEDLRARVFGMAENALGTCGDNVAEGFSSIVRAVRVHEVTEAVKRGDMPAEGVDQLARQEFRLHMLEREVHRLIAHRRGQTDSALAMNWDALRKALHKPDLFGAARAQVQQLQAERAPLEWDHYRLVQEPLETMVHAKVALAGRLDLPEGLPREMANRDVSILTPQDLDDIERAVRAHEGDVAQVRAFLVSNDLWLAGMRLLHAEAIKPIWEAYEENEIWDTDLGLQGSPAFEDAAWQVRRHALAREADELARLAGLA